MMNKRAKRGEEERCIKADQKLGREVAKSSTFQVRIRRRSGISVLLF